MKQHKKIIITVIMIALLISLTMLSAMAFPSTNPANINNYPYWVEYVWNINENVHYFVYTTSKMTVNGANISATTNGYVQYAANTAATVWGTAVNQPEGIYNTNDFGSVIRANYSVGSFIYNGANFITPVNGQTYNDYPPIQIQIEGNVDPYDVVIYCDTDNVSNGNEYIVSVADMIYDENSKILSVSKDNIPYRIGTNTIKLFNIEDYEIVYDQATFSINTTVPSCGIYGLNQVEGYNAPPSINVWKKNYINPIELRVNDEAFEIFYGDNGTYPVERDWIDNLKVGLNRVTLYDKTLNEVVYQVDFFIMRGSEDDDGNFEPDPDSGTTGTDSAIADIDISIPAKPAPDATVLDWIKYVAEVIGYVFQLAIATVIDFAKSVGNMLSSLFDMIRPVLTFIQLMFNSLPSPIAVGMYALFTLTVVFAMIKVIRK